MHAASVGVAPISVQFGSESDLFELPARPDLFLKERDLPDWDDLSYRYLRLIDPYGNTLFSHYQMDAVLPEIERLAHERRATQAPALLQLARRCASTLHTYLWFVGD